MTADQRKRLFVVCQHSWFMADTKPSASEVVIDYESVLLRFDYCIKRGTGSGRLLSMDNSFGHLSPPQSIDEIDKLLLEMACDYRIATVDLLDSLSKAIHDIQRDESDD